MYILFVRFISEYLIFLLFVIVFYYVWKRDFNLCFKIALSVFLTFLLRKFINIFWYEPRPYILEPSLLLYPTHKLPDSSFFSTHASTTMALAGAVYWKFKKTGLYLISGSLLVGLGRVLAGLHYPLDVISGMIIGFLISCVVEIATKRGVKKYITWIKMLS